MNNPLIDIKNLRRSSFKRPGEMFKGTSFENYFEPLEIIGVGAFACVISARSKEDGSLLAIKVRIIWTISGVIFGHPKCLVVQSRIEDGEREEVS